MTFLEQHSEITSIRIVSKPETVTGIQPIQSYNPGTIDISKMSWTDANGNGVIDPAEFNTVKDFKYRKDEGEILWDPFGGFNDGQGGNHSPTMVLEHEAKHAKHRLTNPNQYFIDKNTKTVGGTDNIEEAKTINEANATSKMLNNGDGGRGVTRTRHDMGYSYTTFGPTTIIKNNYIDMMRPKKDNLGGSSGGAYPSPRFDRQFNQKLGFH